MDMRLIIDQICEIMMWGPTVPGVIVNKHFPCFTVVNLFYGDIISFCFDIEMKSYTDKHIIFTKKKML